MELLAWLGYGSGGDDLDTALRFGRANNAGTVYVMDADGNSFAGNETVLVQWIIEYVCFLFCCCCAGVRYKKGLRKKGEASKSAVEKANIQLAELHRMYDKEHSMWKDMTEFTEKHEASADRGEELIRRRREEEEYSDSTNASRDSRGDDVSSRDDVRRGYSDHRRDYDEASYGSRDDDRNYRDNGRFDDRDRREEREERRDDFRDDRRNDRRDDRRRDYLDDPRGDDGDYSDTYGDFGDAPMDRNDVRGDPDEALSFKNTRDKGPPSAKAKGGVPKYF